MRGELSFKNFPSKNPHFKFYAQFMPMNKFYMCMQMINKKCKDIKYKEIRDKESKHKNFLSRLD